MKTRTFEAAPLPSQRHPRKSTFGATAVLTLMLALSATARAQEDEAVNRAYELLASGLAAYKTGNYSAALERFGSAFELVKLPALAVHMARANIKLGRLVSAVKLYRQATQLGDGIGDPQIQARARAEAQSELAALVTKVPTLRITVTGVPPAWVTVRVDGSRVSPEECTSGWPVDPGQHRVIASYGNESEERRVTLAEGESSAIQLVFAQASVAQKRQPDPTTRASEGSNATAKTMTWVGYGIGGTGLLLSGITALAAVSNRHQADDTGCGQQPRGAHCDEAAVNRYSTLRTIAGVGFYTGLAGVVTGTVFYFGTPRQKSTRDAKRHVLPWVGLESAGIEGSF